MLFAAIRLTSQGVGDVRIKRSTKGMIKVQESAWFL
jgi:hypothetical protein